jgi:hypothetical protein
VVTARQRRGTHISSATNKHATIDDTVFSVRPLLRNVAVNSCPRQRIYMQQQKNRWKQHLLCRPCRGYRARTNGKIKPVTNRESGVDSHLEVGVGS